MEDVHFPLWTGPDATHSAPLYQQGTAPLRGAICRTRAAMFLVDVLYCDGRHFFPGKSRLDPTPPSTDMSTLLAFISQEFDHYKPWELACFCCGCALCVLGLYILSTSSEGEASFYRSGELLVENGREQCLLRASHMRRAASERQTDAMARIPASEEQREPNYIAGR